jgi:hypothetical protein
MVLLLMVCFTWLYLFERLNYCQLFSLVEHDLLQEIKSMWKYVRLNHSFWSCIYMIIMVPSGPGG